jgi:hypothetical protein
MPQSLRNLKSSLKQLLVKNADRRWFIPGLRLREILTETVIRQTLLAAKTPSHMVDEVVKHVLEHGVRIYGVLVLIEQVATTVMFMEKGELIDHLPAGSCQTEQYLESQQQQTLSMAVIDQLKHGNEMTLLAKQLTREELRYDDSFVRRLESFFEKALAYDPEDRGDALEVLYPFKEQ